MYVFACRAAYCLQLLPLTLLLLLWHCHHTLSAAAEQQSNLDHVDCWPTVILWLLLLLLLLQCQAYL